MGNISIEKANHLFWLGRYTERVFTTLESYFIAFDRMLDGENSTYQEFCRDMGIPDIYGSREVFLKRYIGDKTDGNSIISNLYRAYDNAIVLRDEISTDTLSYIHMAMNCINGHGDDSLYDLQEILDDLYAFWGSADDHVDDEECRNILKCGKYIERLDLYIRLKKPYNMIEKEFCKLKNRIGRTQLSCDQEAYGTLVQLLSKGEDWKENAALVQSCLAGLLIV